MQISKWIATILFLFSGAIIASNIAISRWGFLTFLIGHIILVVVFGKKKDTPMLLQNLFFIGIDFVGIYRWFIA
jgi:hypothetical protein